MGVLSLKDTQVARLRRTHPLLRHAEIIGKGEFCRVFKTVDPTRVLKLTADCGHYDYLCDRLSPQGPFKPVVYADHGIIGETRTGISLHLIEVERLFKLSPGSLAKRLANKIVGYSDKTLNFRRRNPQLPEDVLEFRAAFPGESEELREFFGELNMFVSNFCCSLDLHMANFMQRAEGSLVFSDPVYNENTRVRHYRALSSHKVTCAPGY